MLPDTTETSMLERVGNLMEPEPTTDPTPKQAPPGVDPDDLDLIEEPEGEPISDAPFDGLELEVSGETKKLSKAEIKAALEEHGSLKQSIESLQQQRAAIEQERKATHEVMRLAPAVEQLRAEGRLLQGMMQGLYQEVQALTESDPIQAFQKRQQLDNLSMRFNQLAQQESQVSGQLAHWQTQQMQAEIAAEGPKLLQALPAWKDPEKRKSDQSFIREYMKREGYSDHEANLVTKSHYVKTLLKAAKYEAIRSAQASKKVTGAPPMAQPGAAQTPGMSKAIAKSDYHKAIKAATTDQAKAKIVQKRLESML